MKIYNEQASEVLNRFNTTREQGLSSAEAQKRLEENGGNKLVEAKKKPLIKRFFEQLADPMIIILIVAALSLPEMSEMW